MKSIIVIPARGGSKGIPRKNLRPVNGKPMLYYSVKAALNAQHGDRVVVSTDDEEIVLFAERFGATAILRPQHLSDDVATLDPVIKHAVEYCEELFGERYGKVITVQPTSPLVSADDIDSTAEKLKGEVQTVLTAIDDRHLCWGRVSGKYMPAYEKRVNRQQLPENYRETGAVVVCSREQLASGSRVGEQVELNVMPVERSFDIDSIADLQLCESILGRKKIVFTVVGYPEVGLGHAFRTVMLANELVGYDLQFLCEKRSELAIRYIKDHNYSVKVCSDGKMLQELDLIRPDLVINDILDTTEVYMKGLKQLGCKIVNFEDLSEANVLADLTINALYSERFPSEKILSGYRYFCLRDEFLHVPSKKLNEKVECVLLTFGGVDEGNLTQRVLKVIEPVCSREGVRVVVIVGPGYRHEVSLGSWCEKKSFCVDLVKNTKRISDFMVDADLAITSGGRTVLELAGVGVPMIVICQNQRETTHTFASSENGVVNLGYRDDVNDVAILEAFSKLLFEADSRKLMRSRMSAMDLSKGKQRVINKITDLIR